MPWPVGKIVVLGLKGMRGLVKNAGAFREVSSLEHKGSSASRKLWSWCVWQKHVLGRSQCCWSHTEARTVERLIETLQPWLQLQQHVPEPTSERVFCWPAGWLLFLLALNEGLNMLILQKVPVLRVYPDGWNNTYTSQHWLQMPEINSSVFQDENLPQVFL